jgi:hypothetical protein
MAATTIKQELLANPKLFDVLLQLVGLTRTKILSDLKAAVRSGAVSVAVPSSYKRLPFTAAWQIAGPYLIVRLRKVLLCLPQERAALSKSLEALNQGTWPGYIRQERAKRQGHEAEGRLAALLLACRIPFEPENKADNPLSGDVQVNGVSFDIVVPEVRHPNICVKSTVHTANIGQYGESKDHLEVDEARRMIEERFPRKRRPLLFAFIDGVGFESNRAGLEGVLLKADEFCQFRTLWKAVVVIAHRLHRPLRLILPQAEIDEYRTFLRDHGFENRVQPKEQVNDIGGAIEAGDGWVVID